MKMMKEQILNLTQHDPTPEQVAEGVGFPSEGIKPLLNFTSIGEAVRPRAVKIVARLLQEQGYGSAFVPYASGPCGQRVMIGGMPRLMGPLEETLLVCGFTPIYAFSERVCVEEMQDDGKVISHRIFRHVGFDAGEVNAPDEDQERAILNRVKDEMDRATTKVTIC